MAMLNTLCKDVVTGLASTLSLATAILSVTGCTLDSDRQADVGSAQQEALTGNFLAGNFLAGNFLAGNFLAGNFLAGNFLAGNGAASFNGLSFDPEATNGISVAGLGLDQVAVSGLQVNGLEANGMLLGGEPFSPEAESDLGVVLQYAIECALEPDQSVTMYSSDGSPVVFAGALGLAPEWADSALTDTGRKYVSACLIARSNAAGKHVRVSVRGGGVVTTAMERSVYSRHEGAFWGNAFGSNPYLATCTVDGGGVSGRECTAGECGFVSTGGCAEVCQGLDPADGHYFDCDGELAVLNTFLPFTETMAFGKEHNCYADARGTMWCWGKNDAGQLGDGTTIDRSRPQAIHLARPVVETAGGARHTCARLDDGSVQCSGDNLLGQLGADSLVRYSATPMEVAELDADVASLASGQNHACALKTDGTLHCWGDNQYGQLGDGTTTVRGAPAHVASLGTSVVRVSLDESADHSCAILADGSVHCWGANSAGQLGDGTTSHSAAPAPMTHTFGGSALGESTDVCTGAQHTCVRQASGEVYCAGSNARGQLGDPAFTSQTATRPVAVALPGSAMHGGLSCGAEHTCALVEGGALYCWGANQHGQLGSGSYAGQGSAQPVQVTGLGAPVAAVSADSQHTCAKLSDSSFHCWGEDRFGLLFASTTSATPVAVALPDPERHTPAGFAVVFAVTPGENTISWLRHRSAELAGYQLLRNGAPVATVGSETVTYTQTGASRGQSCYTMRALFVDGTTSPLTQQICGRSH